MAGERDQLKTMQDRNAHLEGQVHRYKVRKNIEHAIELLQVLIPVQEYREIRAKYAEVKANQRLLHRKVAQLKEKNAPVHARLKYIFPLSTFPFISVF
jgi:chromosome segregation ATPase